MQTNVAESKMPNVLPPRQPGVCVWFTGRSGAGKSTTARVLTKLLQEHGREVTVLDVVPWLEKAAGEKTSEGKLMRKGHVAAEVVRHGGAVICVTISSRPEIRRAARELIGEDHFVEVLMEAPPEVCWERKTSRTHKPSLSKRVKAWLRRVMRPEAQTRSAPDQPIHEPDLTLNTTASTPEENARAIFQYLVDAGFVPS